MLGLSPHLNCTLLKRQKYISTGIFIETCWNETKANLVGHHLGLVLEDTCGNGAQVGNIGLLPFGCASRECVKEKVSHRQNVFSERHVDKQGDENTT